MGLLDGKVAIVTGGGNGIGRAHCLALAAAGARVVVNDLGVDRSGDGAGSSAAQRVAEEVRAAGGAAVADRSDVSTWAGGARLVAAATEAFGRLDILVNNAGILRDKTLLKMDEAMWDAVIAVHLKGTFVCTRLAAEVMRDQGEGGRVINTSSLAGLKGNYGQSNYGAAKAGIYGFTRVTSMELGRHGITVNAIAPVAKTRMTEDLGVVPEHMTAERIAPFIVFLASELGAEVNGRTFGLHGNEIFEYRMEQTPAIDRAEGVWTPREIAARLHELERASAAAAGDSAAAAQEVSALFAAMPGVFRADRAGSWRAALRFVFGDVGPHTLRVAEGRCEHVAGAEGEATCVVAFDRAATLMALAAGTLKAEQAFMAGKIKASNMGDLMKFGAAFELTKLAGAQDTDGAADGAAAGGGAAGMNKAMVGARYRASASFATPEQTEGYARATEDLNPRYLARDGAPPELAPPLFVVRPAHDVMMKAVTDPELGADLLNLVHGEQDMRFVSPVKPWDLLAARCEVSSVEDRSSGQLLTVTTRIMRDGEPVCVIDSGIFVRDRTKKGGGAKTPAAPAEAPPREQLFCVTQPVSDDQPLRYAAVAKDENPIHVDPQVARAAGHPSIILHGLCTMAFCQKAIVDEVLGGDPTRLERLAVRFSRPVLPGQTITITGWRGAEAGTIAFEASNEEGVKVIVNGRCRYTPA